MVSFLRDFIQKSFKLIFFHFLCLDIGLRLFRLSEQLGNFGLEEFFLVNNLLIFFFNKSFLLLTISFAGFYFFLKSLILLLLRLEFIIRYKFLFFQALNLSLEVLSL